MGKRIQIKGQNLDTETQAHVRLFHGITRHRVAWIQQGSTKSDAGTPTDACAVDDIRW